MENTKAQWRKEKLFVFSVFFVIMDERRLVAVFSVDSEHLGRERVTELARSNDFNRLPLTGDE